MTITIALVGLVLLHKTGAETPEIPAIKCVEGTDGTASATTCADGTTMCSQPMFTDYQGFADGVLYACGTCKEGTQYVTCKECEGHGEDACNKPEKLQPAYKCYSAQFDEDQEQFIQLLEPANCVIKEGSTVMCNNPTSTVSAKQSYYTNKNGCGKCDGPTTELGGLCEECGSALCNPLSTSIQCIQGSDGTAAATYCTATKCSKPKFTDYTGFSTVKYACGGCASGTKGTTCEECDGSAEDSCNKPVDLGDDFKCYTYTYNTEKELNYALKDTTCKRSKNAGIKCNMPASTDTAEKYTNTDGCGGCAGTTKTDGACKECTDKTLCNVLELSSAERAAATFLFPLIAVLYCFI